MKKFLLLSLLLLLSNKFILSAQDNSFDKKNSFLLGINYATNGREKMDALLYRNEYIHKFNKYLSLGGGMTFYSYTDSIFYYSPFGGGQYNYFSNTVITFDIVPYLEVLSLKRHFFRFGIGYSLMKLKLLEWYKTYQYTLDNGNKVSVDHYKLINKFYSSYLIHVEYGFRISPQIGISVAGRMYNDVEYFSLAFLGINLLYSF